MRATGMKVAHRVATLRKRRWRHEVRARGADLGHRPVAVSEPAAGETDLAEHRRQRHRRPHRLLAMVGPLQRPRDGDERALGGHAFEPGGEWRRRGSRRRGAAHSASFTMPSGVPSRYASNVA